MSKRTRKILVCLSDEEYSALDRLVDSFSLEGSRASKSFVVRYALKKLPFQMHLNDVFHPASSGLDLQSAC